MNGRRERTFVYYSAADDHGEALLDQALFHADHLDRGLPEPSSSSVAQPGVTRSRYGPKACLEQH